MDRRHTGRPAVSSLKAGDNIAWQADGRVEVMKIRAVHDGGFVLQDLRDGRRDQLDSLPRHWRPAFPSEVHEARAEFQTQVHRRWTRVVEPGEWAGWVGVSDATLADFTAGVVHGRRVDVDRHCTPDCPACCPEGRPAAADGREGGPA